MYLKIWALQHLYLLIIIVGILTDVGMASHHPQDLNLPLGGLVHTFIRGVTQVNDFGGILLARLLLCVWTQ